MEQTVQKAVQTLKNGGTIIYPTETILGIGCLSLNSDSINQVFKVKKRDPNRAMLVLVSDMSMIERYKKNISPLEREMLLSKEPTTVILDHVNGFPTELTGINSSLAFRITSNQLCLELIKSVDQPLVSTSANLSGEKAAINYLDLTDELINKVDFVLKTKISSTFQKPSRIVKIEQNKVKLIRK
ncbi:MAG: L-threonylcarbamoyladenylate synthase [Glaciecola sp.]|jgi:L-threonylcarbamoyladenylate synthase